MQETRYAYMTLLLSSPPQTYYLDRGKRRDRRPSPLTNYNMMEIDRLQNEFLFFFSYFENLMTAALCEYVSLRL